MEPDGGGGPGGYEPSSLLPEGSIPRPQDLERSSSFARSFFQSAGQDLGDSNSIEDAVIRSMSSTASSPPGSAGRIVDDNADGGGGRSGFPNSSSSCSSPHNQYEFHADGSPVADEPGQDRRRPRRRSSRGSLSGSDLAAAAAAEAMAEADGPHERDGPSPPVRRPGRGAGMDGGGSSDDAGAAALPRPGRVDRQTSWYTDALLQGGGAEDLSALLGETAHDGGGSSPMIGGAGGGHAGVCSGSGGGGGGGGAGSGSVSDDDEVLEQYRIMAHVEASIRVKDNTGFDVSDYEKRRKTQPEPAKGEYYTGSEKPKPKPPEARRMNMMGGGAAVAFLGPQEPPLPPRRTTGGRFIQQARLPRVPDLGPGVVIRNTNQAIHIPEGEHAVRCLGCQSKMRVNLYATLVQCPECNTVSPASLSMSGTV